MKLIYLDESGNTGTRIDDPDQQFHLIAALAINDNIVRSVENEIKTLGLKHLGSVSQDTDFEFHGYEIHKGKGRYFSKLKVEQRIEIIVDLITVIKNYDIQIIYTMINKLTSKAKLHPHQLAFLLLTERIEDYLVREESLGLLIADENRDIEQRLIDDLERFKTVDTGFGWRPTKIDHIVDSIHFVKSHNNHLIQLADIVAYILLRGKKTLEQLFKFYSSTENKTTLSWTEWKEEFTSLGQKTDLMLYQLLTYKPFISKEFP